jgi:hypothetical protein
MSRIGFTLGGGSAATLGALAIAHRQDAAAVVALGVAAALASIIAALCTALPDVIAELSARKVAGVKANADADVARERARQRTLLIEAGLGHNLDAAMNLLRLQPLDADVLMDPRFGVDLLRLLLPDPRLPSEPESGRSSSRIDRSAHPAKVPAQDRRSSEEDF